VHKLPIYAHSCLISPVPTLISWGDGWVTFNNASILQLTRWHEGSFVILFGFLSPRVLLVTHHKIANREIATSLVFGLKRHLTSQKKMRRPLLEIQTARLGQATGLTKWAAGEPAVCGDEDHRRTSISGAARVSKFLAPSQSQSADAPPTRPLPSDISHLSTPPPPKLKRNMGI
jgi:hypothetical protein